MSGRFLFRSPLTSKDREEIFHKMVENHNNNQEFYTKGDVEKRAYFIFQSSGYQNHVYNYYQAEKELEDIKQSVQRELNIN